VWEDDEKWGRARLRTVVEFPERPNALGAFLSTLQPELNISLFHYRNHGADVGKVLVGIQVPPGAEKGFENFLDELGYPFVEETGNQAYRDFLCNHDE
jgi:threonine dehydratase